MKRSHLLLIMIGLLMGSVNLSAQKVGSATSLPAKPVVYTLQDAISAACQNNAELHKSRLTTQSMQELKSELYTKYFPHISASGTYFERSRGLAEGSLYLDALFNVVDNIEEPQVEGVQILKRGFLGSMAAIQPIYTGGRLTAANKLAQLGAEATREKMAIQQDQLTQEVEKYFWQLVQLYEAERSLQTMDSLIERASHDASTALKAGLVTKGDKMQVDIYASKIEGMHLQVASGKELCKEYLSYLLGTERVDSIQWEDIYLRKNPEEYFADPNAVVMGRHETQLLQIQLSAAKLRKKFTLGNMLPSVGAAFSFNYHYFFAKNDKGTYHSFFDKKSTAWLAAAHVSIPISGWWGGKHALRRADIGIEKADAGANFPEVEGA